MFGWGKKRASLEKFNGVAICGEPRWQLFAPIIPYLTVQPIKIIDILEPIRFILANPQMPGYKCVLDIPKKKEKVVWSMLAEFHQKQIFSPYDVSDGIRMKFGNLFLLNEAKKFFEKDVFHIVFGVCSPEECDALRKMGMKLFFWKAYPTQHRWEDYTFQRILFDAVLRTQHNLQSNLTLIFSKLMASGNQPGPPETSPLVPPSTGDPASFEAEIPLFTPPVTEDIPTNGKLEKEKESLPE